MIQICFQMGPIHPRWSRGGALVYIVARDVVESLCRDLEFYAFKSGDVIVRQGEEGDHLFIVEA